MKDKVIEAAGKTWRFLGQNGETEISAISNKLKEKDEVVYQALGWLAREDKLEYTTKRKKDCVSLIQSELESFYSNIENIEAIATEKKVVRKRKTSVKASTPTRTRRTTKPRLNPESNPLKIKS